MTVILLLKLAAYAMFSMDVSLADSVASKRLVIASQHHAYTLPYVSNMTIGEINYSVKHVVIVIHGLLKDANAFYQDVERIVPFQQRSATMVIAPQFLTHADVKRFDLPDNTLSWSLTGWSSGATSLYPRAANISSFAVLTQLVCQLVDPKRYPELEKLSIIGFSAGAQLLQRYTLLGRVDTCSQVKGVQLHYYIISPSSYMYLSGKRFTQSSVTNLIRTIDNPAEACTHYNDYKYGLQQLTAERGMRLHAFAGQHIDYVVGAQDNRRGLMLDKSCAADLQGHDRLTRAKLFYHSLLEHYGKTIKKTQRLSLIKGAGHSFKAICENKQMKALLFDTYRSSEFDGF